MTNAPPSPQTPRGLDLGMNVKRGLIVWFTMIPVAFANGAVRQFVYGPVVGEPTAHQVSCFTAMALFGLLIWIASRRWAFSSQRHAFHIGLFWASLTVLFETGLGLTGGMGWREIFSTYAFWNGELWALVIVFLVAAPVVVAWRRTRAASCGESAPEIR